MHVIYAGQPFSKGDGPSIFLAGPTPRSNKAKSWRPAAIKILVRGGYDGLIFVPESCDHKVQTGYVDNLEWETKGLTLAKVILFWIPREMHHMPALTTNVEWGMWYNSGKVVLGAPAEAVKISYLEWHGNRFGIERQYTLENTIDEALDLLEDKYGFNLPLCAEVGK